MSKIILTIELDYDEEIMHSGEDDKEAKRWFIEDILKSGKGDLFLHSGEIGDTVGTVKVIKVELSLITKKA